MEEVRTMSKHSTITFLTVALLFAPVTAVAQSSGGGSSGGGAGGASGGGTSSGVSSPTTSTNGASGPAANGDTHASQVPNGSGFVDNNNNVTNRVQNLQTTPSAQNPQVTPGTNTAGTANSSGGTATSRTVGSAGSVTGGNRAAGNSRIDGTVTNGPAMPGDDVIRAEDSQDSGVDKKIKSICKGC